MIIYHPSGDFTEAPSHFERKKKLKKIQKMKISKKYFVSTRIISWRHIIWWTSTQRAQRRSISTTRARVATVVKRFDSIVARDTRRRRWWRCDWWTKFFRTTRDFSTFASTSVAIFEKKKIQKFQFFFFFLFCSYHPSAAFTDIPSH